MTTVKGRIFSYLIAFTFISVTMAAVGRWYLHQTRDALTSLSADRVNALNYLKTTSDALGLSIVDVAHKANDRAVTEAIARSTVGTARSVARDQWRRFTQTRLTPEQLRAVDQLTP